MLFKNINYADENYELQCGNILVENGAIKSITADVPSGYSGEVYDGKNRIAIPGFFNLHCHSPMILLRGRGDGLPLQRWLNEAIFPFEAKLTPDDMYWSTLLASAEMIKSGAVSFTDMYFYLPHIAKAVDECGLKVNLCNGVVCFDPTKKFENTNEYRQTEELRSFIKTLNHDRIIADAGVHAEYTSGPEMVREVAAYAKQNGLNIHVHASETALEHAGSKERRCGMTPVEYLESCGVLDVPATLAHCVHIEDRDMDIIKAKGATVSHNPSSNLKLGSGIARITTMLEKGLNVGFGTDGAASNDNLNMLEEITLGSLLARGATMDPTAMNLATTLKMATINGAVSQSRKNCGAIKVGNRADIVVYDQSAEHHQPVANPLSNVFYAGQASDICMSMVDGRVLYKDGALTTIDIEKVIAECNKIQKRILSEM